MLSVLGAVECHVAAYAALVCAALSLLCSLFGAVGFLLHRNARAESRSRPGLLSACLIGALLFAFPAAGIECVILGLRAVSVAIDLLDGFPAASISGYCFDRAGLWPLAMLCGSCAVSLLSTGDRRLWTCLLLAAGATTTWACLLVEPYHMDAVGAWERTGGSMLLMGSLSLLLLLASLTSRFMEPRPSARLAAGTGDEPAALECGWPGFRPSCGVIAMVVLLLAAYHLALPVSLRIGGFGLAALVTAGSAITAAAASLLLVTRRWSRGVGEAALGLSTLSLCAVLAILVPSRPVHLGERYPMMFRAWIFGLSAAAALHSRLAERWSRRPEEVGVWDNDTWTARMVPHTTRFSFLSAALAVMVAILMAVWPRLTFVAATDDNLGRVLGGMAANLFLLMVTLWCARRRRKPAFHVLSGLALLSTAGFLVIRLLPFASRFR